MTYAIRGAPDDSDVPEFLKMRYNVSTVYLPSLVSALKGELSQVPQEAFFSGLEGVLVPEPLLNEVRQQVNGPLRMNGSKVKIVRAPSAARALQIIDDFVRKAEAELPPQYHGEARSAIDAVGPRYAANVGEAAKALGVSLPQATV